MRNHITAQDAERLTTQKLEGSSAQVNLAQDRTLKATTPQGHILDIVSLLPQDGSRAKFVLSDVRNSNHRFIVCTEQDETGNPVQWVFPEMCFTHRGWTSEDGTAEVDLDLPGQKLDGQTIRDALCFFEERWDPIVQFDDFREYMPPPDHPEFADRWTDMEDILELIWGKETPDLEEEDFVPLKEIPDEDGRLKLRVRPQAADSISQIPEAEKTEVMDGIRSILEDPYSPDVLGIEGTRGNYRIIKSSQD